jgi:hypothetical protein
MTMLLSSGKFEGKTSRVYAKIAQNKFFFDQAG